MYDVDIGDTFSIVFDRFKVVESNRGCEDCEFFLNNNQAVCSLIHCNDFRRRDNKNVIFKKVSRETLE